MKSSCANLGANQLAELCLQLERLGRAGSLDGAGEILTQMNSTYDDVQTKLGETRPRDESDVASSDDTDVHDGVPSEPSNHSTKRRRPSSNETPGA